MSVSCLIHIRLVGLDWTALGFEELVDIVDEPSKIAGTVAGSGLVGLEPGSAPTVEHRLAIWSEVCRLTNQLLRAAFFAGEGTIGFLDSYRD